MTGWAHPAASCCEEQGAGMNDNQRQEGIVLTEEQKRRRRARSIAIALALGALVLLFYVVTIVKLGPGVLQRPL
jgi:hypothetical protein